jgi:hypothetical protein
MCPKKSVPLPIDAVLAAVEAEESIWEEVRRGEQNRSPMFEFARCLRTREEFWELDALEALELVQRCLAADDRTTLTELFSDYDDPEASLIKAWSIIVLPRAFETALRLAQERPVQFKRKVSEKFSRFISLCFHLQRLSRDAPIFIPCEVFGTALGVSGKTISTYRDLAEKMGFLELVSRADRRARRAERFLFHLPLQLQKGQ